MANLAPASNVQAAAVAGFLAAVIEHICEANGIDIPPDVSASLPLALSVVVAHIWDLCTGGNIKDAPKP